MIDDKMKPRPRRPAELTDANAKKFWDAYMPMLWDGGTLTEVNIAAFVLLCELHAEVRTLTSLAKEQGDFRTPLRLRDARKMYLDLLARFGICGPGPQGRAIETKVKAREQFEPEEETIFTKLRELGVDHPLDPHRATPA